MEPEPVSHRLSEMIPVARLFSREEAEELSALAADAGVLAVIADPRRLPQAFDATLGALDAAQAFTVYVARDDVSKLRTKLEQTLEIDPLDPLCALSNAELEAIVEAPRDANLTEWVIARKLLASRAPGDDPARSGEDIASWTLDPHADSDARLARWLGAVVLGSFAAAVVLVTMTATEGFGLVSSADAEAWSSGPSGADTPHTIPLDKFGAPLRELIPLGLPAASSLALIFSWRILSNGAWRWMFPNFWRQIGWWTFTITLAALLICLFAVAL
jgi:hypothetical protein